ncbi:MAG: hypothetical protein JKY23_01400 [Nitrospinaceae bacterium]|nr:hypothetical protein [Nitrospinaceae bacterium]
MEIKVGICDRRKLKILAHKVFSRLVVDRETDKVNNSQDLLMWSGLSVIFFATTAFLFFLDQRFELSIQIISAYPGLKGFAQPIVILTPLLLVGGLLMLLRPRFSKFSYYFIGELIVNLRRLRPQSEQAESSLQDNYYWIKSDGNRIAVEAIDCSGSNCSEILPAKVSAALTGMMGADTRLPFVIVRGLLERKYWFLYLAKWFRSERPNVEGLGEEASYYQRARTIRNAIKIGICLNVLDAEFRDEAPNGLYWKRDHYTRFDYQHVPFWDKYDIAVRMRSSGPHMRWPQPQNASSDGEMPTVRVLAGIENPCQFDFRILSVSDVIQVMPDTLKEFGADFEGDSQDKVKLRREQAARALVLLATSPLSVFGRREEYSLQPKVARDSVEAPIIRRLDGQPIDKENIDTEELLNADWGMRWDPNRIILSKLNPASDLSLMQAIALLMHAISNSTKEKSARIKLRRGDVVFIDNRRALVGRFEPRYAKIAWWKRVIGYPPEWWIRGFYGFRQCQQDSSAEEHPTVRFEQNDITPSNNKNL